MNTREREVWTRIIEIYKHQPHMWDKKNKNYFNRKLRQETFEKMFEIYEELNLDIKIPIFKKKFENMRTSFAREFKKVTKSKQTRSSSENKRIYKPSLWYYNLFSFYEEFVVTTEPSRVAIEESDFEEISQSFDDEPSGTWFVDLQTDNMQSLGRVIKTEEEATPSRKRRSTVHQKEEKLIDTTQVNLSSKTDDWEVIGKSIGLQLRDLSEHQQIIAQKLISDTIYYGKLEKLTEDSSITLEN